MISHLFWLILKLSKVRIAANIVICNKKSIRTANAAIIQNDYRAGIWVKVPTINARIYQKAAVHMLGPTFDNPAAIL